MRPMNIILKITFLSLLIPIASSTQAHGGHFRVGIGFGYPYGVYAPYPYYGYGYPYAYPQTPVIIEQAPVVLQQQVAPPVGQVQMQSSQVQAPAAVWYYCEKTKSYYPYVNSCSEGWKTVPATPPSN